MAYFRLALKPGIDKQNTEYGAEGGWIDGDYIRFRYGLPEKLGGWTSFAQSQTYLVGVITDIITWNSLNGAPYLMVGTNKKLYVYQGGLWADITPIRETTAPGAGLNGVVTGGAACAGAELSATTSEEPSRLSSVAPARRRVRVMAHPNPGYWAGETLDMLKSGTRIAGVAVREK